MVADEVMDAPAQDSGAVQSMVQWVREDGQVMVVCRQEARLVQEIMHSGRFASQRRWSEVLVDEALRWMRHVWLLRR